MLGLFQRKCAWKPVRSCWGETAPDTHRQVGLRLQSRWVAKACKNTFKVMLAKGGTRRIVHVTDKSNLVPSHLAKIHRVPTSGSYARLQEKCDPL